MPAAAAAAAAVNRAAEAFTPEAAWFSTLERQILEFARLVAPTTDEQAVRDLAINNLQRCIPRELKHDDAQVLPVFSRIIVTLSHSITVSNHSTLWPCCVTHRLLAPEGVST